jgi:hypothetical protein
MEKLTILELKKKLERLTLPRIRSETAKIIRETPELVFRKQDEFRQGENPDGGVIGYYRNPEYQMMKMASNPLAGGTVDLILTGSTIRHLQVVSLGNGEFYLYSTDSKWPDLISKYGKQIQYINSDFFKGLQKNDYAPKLMERLRQIMK